MRPMPLPSCSAATTISTLLSIRRPVAPPDSVAPSRFHLPPPRLANAPGRGAPSPGTACGASATPSCSCPVQEPVGGQARSFHSSGWSCATSLETIPSGEDECLETRFPRAPTLASDSLCKAKVRAKSAKHFPAGIEGNESLPASATRKDIADTRHHRKSAAPVPPMCAGNPRPLQTAISWGRLSQVNSPIAESVSNRRPRELQALSSIWISRQKADSSIHCKFASPKRRKRGHYCGDFHCFFPGF